MTREHSQEIEVKAQRMVEATVAGSALAMRRWRERPVPRRDRTWTGVLAGKRAWRGQRVVLPDNSVGYIFGVQRGWAAIWRPAPFVVGEREHLVLPAEKLTPYKLPSAVALGRLKLGRKEKPSRRKLAACRVNGVMPCRPGRRRGRPRKAHSQDAALDTVRVPADVV